MHKTLVVALAVGMVSVAAPAQADPPTVVTPEETSFSFVVEVCEFDVLLEFEGKSGAVIFEPRDHRVEERLNTFDPGITATLTNSSTGKSITVNAAGPMTQTISPNEDGTFTGIAEHRGNWIHIHEADGEILLTSGYFRSTAQLDANLGLISLVEDLSRARVVNLCDALS